MFTPAEEKLLEEADALCSMFEQLPPDVGSEAEEKIRKLYADLIEVSHRLISALWKVLGKTPKDEYDWPSSDDLAEGTPAELVKTAFDVVQHYSLLTGMRLRAIGLVKGDEVAGWTGYDDLGWALMKVRTLAGLTQQDLATQLNVSKAQISHIETHRDARRVPMELVFNWLDACDYLVRWRWVKFATVSKGGMEVEDRVMALSNRIRRLPASQLSAVEALVDGLERMKV